MNYPILIRKGRSKLALYGLGNVRDERLHRTFVSHGVKWVRPDETEGDWFNIAVLHQNRVGKELHGKAYISAKMLPDFLDLVVWGHEHEFVGDEASEEGSFIIVQPGSSIATSLCAAEAVEKSLTVHTHPLPPRALVSVATSLAGPHMVVAICCVVYVSGMCASSRSRAISIVA